MHTATAKKSNRDETGATTIIEFGVLKEFKEINI